MFSLRVEYLPSLLCLVLAVLRDFLVWLFVYLCLPHLFIVASAVARVLALVVVVLLLLLLVLLLLLLLLLLLSVLLLTLCLY